MKNKIKTLAKLRLKVKINKSIKKGYKDAKKNKIKYENLKNSGICLLIH